MCSIIESGFCDIILLSDSFWKVLDVPLDVDKSPLCRQRGYIRPSNGWQNSNDYVRHPPDGRISANRYGTDIN